MATDASESTRTAPIDCVQTLRNCD